MMRRRPFLKGVNRRNLGLLLVGLLGAVTWVGFMFNGVSEGSVSGRRALEDVRDRRKKVVAFVGVQTGFTRDSSIEYNYTLRRAALRKTWFPPTQQDLDRLEQEESITVRFVIGHTDNTAEEDVIAKEASKYGGFIRIDFQERYLNLAHKTLAFLKHVVQNYEVKYIVKVDDDVYFRLDRLPSALRQWSGMQKDYVGCMKRGEIYTDKNMRWYEPQHAILGSKNYFTHTWGCMYVLSGWAAELVSKADDNTLRFFNNEDVTIGAWMLAYNVSHYDDRRVCQAECTPHSLVVYDFPRCAGLCEPHKQLLELHADPNCRTQPFPEGEQDVPLLPEIIRC